MKDFSEHEGNPVSFRMFPKMPDILRYLIVAVLLIGGFVIQTDMDYVIPGFVCLLLASLFLMFKGIDRRIFRYTLNENNDWVKTEKENIKEMLRIVSENKRWDKNIFELSNAYGCLTFVLVCIILVVLIVSGIGEIVVIDVLVLFLPFYLSGILKIDKMPPIIIKTNNIVLAANYLMKSYKGYDYNFYTLLSPVKNKTKPAPKDIKIKIIPPDVNEKFLGIYGQCSLNNVSGTFYPYLYFVIVFSKGYDLKNKISGIIGTSNNITREYTQTADAEVLVVRQKTTRTSGYQTKPAEIYTLLNYTIAVYEKYLK